MVDYIRANDDKRNNVAGLKLPLGETTVKGDESDARNALRWSTEAAKHAGSARLDANSTSLHRIRAEAAAKQAKNYMDMAQRHADNADDAAVVACWCAAVSILACAVTVILVVIHGSGG